MPKWIGHVHVAGVPGRGELDERQEINFPAVMRALLETGYQGYVGQEFIPDARSGRGAERSRDPVRRLGGSTREWSALLRAWPQNFTLTGIGANASGQGQSKMSWGSCAFDGTNTNYTLSGTFTGFGGGGNYSFVITYPGNGAFPLNAITNPGSDLFAAQAMWSRYSPIRSQRRRRGTARARPGDTITLYGVGFGTVTPDIPADQRPSVGLAGFLRGSSRHRDLRGICAGLRGPLSVQRGSAQRRRQRFRSTDVYAWGDPGPQNLVIAIQN